LKAQPRSPHISECRPSHGRRRSIRTAGSAPPKKLLFLHNTTEANRPMLHPARRRHSMLACSLVRAWFVHIKPGNRLFPLTVVGERLRATLSIQYRSACRDRFSTLDVQPVMSWLKCSSRITADLNLIRRIQHPRHASPNVWGKKIRWRAWRGRS